MTRKYPVVQVVEKTVVKGAHCLVPVGFVLPSLERPVFEVSDRPAVDDAARLTAQMLHHIRCDSAGDWLSSGGIEGERVAHREPSGNCLQERIESTDAVAVREALEEGGFECPTGRACEAVYRVGNDGAIANEGTELT